ncbi:MAG: pyridoxal-phosphate dependent enzyme [Polyangia bacterium]
MAELHPGPLPADATRQATGDLIEERPREGPGDVPGAVAATPPRALRAQLPRLHLGRFPTPLERCPGLAPESVELWVLREDLAGSGAGSGAGNLAESGPGGVRYGGNKLRKLELVLAAPRLREGLEQGRPATLLTYGGYGSHHVLATALCAQPRGHRVAAILTPQPLTRWSHKTLRALLHSGATLLFARHLVEVPVLLARARLRLPVPVVELPPGGSSPLGVLAWARGGREIAAQVAAGSCPRFDAVYVALGSGGMAAGLLLGLGAAAAELVAVRAVPWPLSSGARVRWLAHRARRFLLRAAPGLGPGLAHGAGGDGLELDLTGAHPMPRLRVDGSQVGPGYGAATAAALEAVSRAAAVGLRLEPTYTGKTLAALLADAASGRLAGKRVLLVHSASSVDPPLCSQAEAAVPAWLQDRLRDMPHPGDEAGRQER